MEADHIQALINDWDPIGLIAIHAPPDEYCDEIKKIHEWCLTHSVEPQNLAEAIYQIFVNSFGEEVFSKTYEDCLEIAESIYHVTKK